MRWRSFSGTLIFGGLAAALLPLFVLLHRFLTPHAGSGLGLYLVAVAAVYGALLAPLPAARALRRRARGPARVCSCYP